MFQLLLAFLFGFAAVSVIGSPMDLLEKFQAMAHSIDTSLVFTRQPGYPDQFTMILNTTTTTASTGEVEVQLMKLMTDEPGKRSKVSLISPDTVSTMVLTFEDKQHIYSHTDDGTVYCVRMRRNPPQPSPQPPAMIYLRTSFFRGTLCDVYEDKSAGRDDMKTEAYFDATTGNYAGEVVTWEHDAEVTVIERAVLQFEKSIDDSEFNIPEHVKC